MLGAIFAILALGTGASGGPGGVAPLQDEGGSERSDVADFVDQLDYDLRPSEETLANVDELLAQLDSLEGEERARALAVAANASLRAFGEHTLGLAFEAVEACREAGLESELPRALRVYGTSLSQAGEYEEAFDVYAESVEIARKIGDDGQLAGSLSSWSITARRAGAVETALDLASEAFELATELDDPVRLTSVIGNNIAYWTMELGRLDEARTLFEKLLVETDHIKMRYSMESGLAHIALLEGDPEEARRLLDIAVERGGKLVDGPFRAGGILLRARTYAAEGDFVRTRDLCRQALSGLEPWPKQHGVCRIELGRALCKLGDTTGGLGLVRDVAENNADATVRLTALEVLADGLADQGSMEEAYAILLRAKEQEESLQTKDSLRQISTLRARMNAELQLRELEREAALAAAAEEIARLDAQRAELEAQRAQAEIQRERTLRNAALAGAALLLACGVWAARSVVHRRIARQRLEDETQHNRQLESALAERTDSLRQESEARLELERRLERHHRDRALGQLTAGVAHDFNNLLQVILNSAEVVRDSLGNRVTATQSDLLSACVQSTKIGRGITQQLLSYARRSLLDPTPTGIGEFFEESHELFRSTLGEEVGLEFADYSDGALLLLDQAQLTTAFINLLSNARDALPRGGTVTVVASRMGRDTLPEGLSVTATDGSSGSAGEVVCLSIRDDGVGMTPDALERACEPFYSSKQGETAGTGLGLSTVTGFVSQSGGDLRIASAVDQGTTVELYFPILSAAQLPAPRPRVASDRPLSSLGRLLVVEDNDSVRRVVIKTLASLGLDEVVEATTAEEGWMRVREDRRIEVVLSDVRLPGAMDGVELAKRIGGLGRSISVVLMTGYTRGIDPEYQGVVLRKPFQRQDLIAALTPPERKPALGAT